LDRKNIQPNAPNDIDRVLFEHIKPMVFFLKSKAWIVSWHFLREDINWRGRGLAPPRILHIRLRVRSTSVANIRKARRWLEQVLDGLQQIGKIAAHYSGKHGTPNRYYKGERKNFNQRGRTLHRNGWKIAQKWLEIGSEIELIFLENRFRGVHLGPRFIMRDILHFFGNQCNKAHSIVQIGGQPYFFIAI